MNNVYPIRIETNFILHRTLLTSSEICFGLRNGWITTEDVVALSTENYVESKYIDDFINQAVLLTILDVQRDRSIVEQLCENVDCSADKVIPVWIFLTLSWLYERRQYIADPFEVIEFLYATFNYPDEMKGLIRYMPAESGQELGLKAIEKRWEDFVLINVKRFRSRFGDDR